MVVAGRTSCALRYDRDWLAVCLPGVCRKWSPTGGIIMQTAWASSSYRTQCSTMAATSRTTGEDFFVALWMMDVAVCLTGASIFACSARHRRSTTCLTYARWSTGGATTPALFRCLQHVEGNTMCVVVTHPAPLCVSVCPVYSGRHSMNRTWSGSSMHLRS